MAGDWSDKDLPRANKNISPAVYDEKEKEWVPLFGRENQMWVNDPKIESKIDILIDKVEELIDIMDDS